MNTIIGMLHRLSRRLVPLSTVPPGAGQRIQAGEQEAARRRLLDQARDFAPQPKVGAESVDRWVTAPVPGPGE
ncbi:hypothetical protein GCM10027259_02460 [Micromonospora palomenae]|uniref:hypothetical protein n=1 Tax=Micromonospora palomenae TaxID=1461247 RepID=UPI0012B7718A|nr:hypothetical protein [Micromonospora palomenae]